jgi:hypothetical protein
MDLAKLHTPIVEEFQTIAALNDWVAGHVSPLIDDILIGGTLSERATSLLVWMEGQGQTLKVLKALADNPPNEGRRLPALIYRLTNGDIRPTMSIATGMPPVEPHRDWFVTGRPFVNREGLRTALETFDHAANGANSVLVIEGGERTGKTHGIRLAAQCAPQARFNPVDMAIWGTSAIGVAALAQAIVPAASGMPNVDETKEHAAVPPLHTWLVGKLKNTRQWIIVDHCNRLNLSSAAETLLFELASTIEKGFLPGVRLVLADVQRSRLPDSLKTNCRYDRAELPDRVAVKKWCQTLAAHVNTRLDDQTLAKHLDTVFAVDATTNQPVSMAEFEERLQSVFADIRAAAPRGQ